MMLMSAFGRPVAVRKDAIAAIRTCPEDAGCALVELITGTCIRVHGTVEKLATQAGMEDA